MQCLSLAIHDALAEVRVHLQEGELLFLYVVSVPDRTRVLYDLLADRLHTMAGIQLHEGKTRTRNAAGECPPGWLSWGPIGGAPAE